MIKETTDRIDWKNALIYVNGFAKDENYELRENDVVTIRQFPSAITSSVALNVLIWTGIAIASGVVLGGVWHHFGDKIKSGLLSWLKSDNDSTSSSAEEVQSKPSIRGCKNQSALGKVIPFVLGKSLFTPFYIGKPYTTIDGTDGENQYFHCLFLLGYNDIKVTDVSMGIYSLASNKEGIENGALTIDGTTYKQEDYGIELELQQGTNEVSLYDQKVIQTDYNTELSVVHTSEEDSKLVCYGFSAYYPQKIEVEIQFNGLVDYTSKGAKQNCTAKIALQMSVDGGNTWIPFKEFTGCSSYEEKDITIQNVTSRCTESTFIKQKAETLRYVASRTFTYAEVNTTDGTFTYEENGETKHGIKNNIVELRIVRNNYNDSERKVDTAYFTSVRTWCYDKVKSDNAGELVAQTPMIEKYRNRTARLGFKIKAGDELSETIDEINCIVQSKARVWDSETQTWSKTTEVTDNPASLSLLALTGGFRGNKKYEIDDTGDYPTADKIDLYSFGKCYEWCAEQKTYGGVTGNRFCCDGVLTTKKKTIDLVNQILATCRANIVMNGAKYGILIDKPVTLKNYILNHQNILSMECSKNFDEEIDGIMVNYISALNDYAEDSILVVPDDIKAKLDSGELVEADLNIESADYPFITNPYRAKALGLYQLAVAKLRPETWKIKVAQEGNVIELGNLVEIQSDILSVGIGEGGEIKGVDVSDNYITAIQTDGQFEVDDYTKTYCVEIQQTSESYEPSVIVKKVTFTENGTFSKLTFETPISLDETVIPCIGDIVSFGLYGYESTDSLCVGKAENGDGTFDLTFVPYQEGVYTADEGFIEDFVSKVTPASNSVASIPVQSVTPDEMYTQQATTLEQIEPIVEEIAEPIVEETVGTKIVEVYPRYIGPFETAPENASYNKGDWYFNSTDVKIYVNSYDTETETYSWNEVELTKSTRYMYNEASSDILAYTDDEGDIGLFSQIYASNISAMEILFKKYVASASDSPVAGDKIISMGKNPVDELDTDFNFNIQSFLGTFNNKQIWKKDFYTKKNNLNGADIYANGLIFAQNGIETFGDIYGNPQIKDTVDYENGTSNKKRYTVAVLGDTYYLFKSLNYSLAGEELDIYSSTNGKTFTKISPSGSTEGMLIDAKVFNGLIILVTLSGNTYEVYKFDPVNNYILQIYSTDSNNVFNELRIIDDKLFFYQNGTEMKYITKISYSATTVNVTGYEITKLTDGVYLTSSTPYHFDDYLDKEDTVIYLWDSDFNLITSYSVIGNPVTLRKSLSYTVYKTSAIYGHNGILYSFVFVSDNNGFLMKSLDGGKTWNDTGFDVTYEAVQAVRYFSFFAYKNIVVIYGTSQVIYSMDNGETFQNISTDVSKSEYTRSYPQYTDNNEIFIPFADSDNHQYAKLIVQNKFNLSVEKSDLSSGYLKLSNGLIVCWGQQTYSKSVGGGNNVNGDAITFPCAFTVTPSIQATHFDGNQFNMSIVDISTSGFTPKYRNVNTNTTATTHGCFWFAIGF